LWQQWRGIEVETAERARVQSAWILQGALDWARLILREDARTGGTDHLAEPWAIPLQEARLSTFLATREDDGDNTQTVPEAFLSGQISDLQGRLNVANLIEKGRPHPPSVRAFARLFEALRLPSGELVALIQNLQRALEPDDPAAGATAGPSAGKGYTALVPRTVDQLAWLGVSPASITTLRPYLVVLPERTAVNINTAPALVLYASVPGLSMANAQRLVTLRAQAPYQTVADAARAMDGASASLTEGQLGVSSRFFEVLGQMRLDTRVVQERSIVQRDGLVVKLLWRERGAVPLTVSLQ
jgi:general secretion pathway protein K